MNLSTPLEVFDYLQKNNADDMLSGLKSIVATDTSLYKETHALIVAHQQNQQQTLFSSTIDETARHLTDDQSLHSLTGTQVGVYQVNERIGHGGMGVVYKGERNDGQLQHKVAIKFIYPSITQIIGSASIGREAQYLADLNHPNISNIITVGNTEQLVTYFVMEWVDGVPADEYCHIHALRLNERLRLFTMICDAVSYAHQNMVIHADIKPNNILVNSDGFPKLMDFGISKQMDAVLNEPEAPHLSLNNAMSERYASPEQQQGKKLTAASDIYSLGVTLKSMLAGINPLPGEVTSILAKACNEQSENRYVSARELSNSITAYLHKMPLPEHSSSAFYVLQKFIHRNTLACSAALLFVVTSTTGALHIYQQNKELTEQVEISRQVTAFLTGMFDQADIDKNTPQSIEALIEKSSQRILSEQWQSPLVKASLFKAIGKVHQGRSNHQKALSFYEKAIPIFEKENVKERFVAQNELAQIHIATGNPDIAQQILQDVIDNAFYTPAVYEAFNLMGLALYTNGQYEQARDYYFRSLKGYRSLQPVDNFMVSTVLGNLGVSYLDEGNNSKALGYFEQAVALDIQMYGNATHPRTALHLQQLGGVQANLGDFESGLKNLKKALAMFTEISPDGHPRVNVVYNNLAVIYGRDLNDPKTALVYLHKALDYLNLLNESASQGAVFINHNIAKNTRLLGQYIDALTYHEKSLALAANFNLGDYIEGMLIGEYGKTLMQAGNTNKASQKLMEAIRLLQQAVPDHPIITEFKTLIENNAA